MKHMIILLDAGLENIGVVQKRIQFYFDANEISKNYKLEFTVSNHMDAPGEKKEKDEGK